MNNPHRKTILIVFPDEYLPFSPTILNLIDELKLNFIVNVVAVDNGSFDLSKIEIDGLNCLKIPKVLSKILAKVYLYKLFKSILLLLKIRRFKADQVIGVDSIGLWVSIMVFHKCHFLSLEVVNDLFMKVSRINSIQSVLIQTAERLNFILPNFDKPIFYVQNAPVFNKTFFGQRKLGQQINAIFLGNVIFGHGVDEFLKAISSLDYIVVTIKGIIPDHIMNYIKKEYMSLITSGQLIIDSGYVKQSDVIKYLEGFDVGFCFYNLDKIKSINSFNYFSSPSGKMFNYFAAGVPVIGSNILGLSPVMEFNAGVLLDDISPSSIESAIADVRENYDEYRQGCFKAATFYDFHKRSERFVDFLKSPIGDQ